MSHIAELKKGGTIIIGKKVTFKGVQYYELADGKGKIRSSKVGRVLPNRHNIFSEDLAQLKHKLRS